MKYLLYVARHIERWWNGTLVANLPSPCPSSSGPLPPLVLVWKQRGAITVDRVIEVHPENNTTTCTSTEVPFSKLLVPFVVSDHLGQESGIVPIA